jgi:hypothetical protein
MLYRCPSTHSEVGDLMKFVLNARFSLTLRSSPFPLCPLVLSTYPLLHSTSPATMSSLVVSPESVYPFPVEILTKIVLMLVDDKGSLCRLRLASRLADSIARSYVFRDIELTDHVPSMTAFSQLYAERPSIVSSLQSVSVTTTGLLFFMLPLRTFFNALGSVPSLREVSFSSCILFDPLNSHFVSSLLPPVSTNITSLSLVHVHDLPPSVVFTLTSLVAITVSGVRCMPAYSIQEYDQYFFTQSSKPAPLVFRYSDRCYLTRRVLDDRVDAFSDDAKRMDLASISAPHVAHPCPLVTAFDWSRLLVLHLETGFSGDVIALRLLLPLVAPTLECLTVELTGLTRASI